MLIYEVVYDPSITVNEPNSDFNCIPLFDIEYVRNGTIYTMSTLTVKEDSRNFIIRLLFKDMY